ncbi:MAG: ABC transporter permease [Acidobacteriota bacterium]|nr:ABC transporter permease [Blastocatellia bacterium]MDW8240697.1 ABC transporter permease [Acidobacteriota bacterium]
MVRLLVKRVLQAIPLLLGVSLLSFFIIALTPGDPLAELLERPNVSPETIEALRQRLGLDLPVPLRYGHWLSGLLRGDFGVSFQYQTPVATLMAPALLNTLTLSLSATLIALVVGIPLGVVAAVRRGGWVDRITGWVAMISLSTPRIFLALLALVLAAQTGWFPIGGQYSRHAEQMNWLERLMDAAHHLILPALILSVAPLAVYLRQMRANLLDVLEEDFVRSARAKGLRETTVVVKHALRAALNPIITLFGYSIGNLLSGSALVETVMAWPGMGKLTVEAVLSRDMYVVMASVMVASAMLIVGNLIADVLLGLNDPRAKLELNY